MAVSQCRASVVSLAIVAIFALVASTTAQSPAPAPAPAPVPESAAGIASPSFAVGCAIAVVALVFGSALRI